MEVAEIEEAGDIQTDYSIYLALDLVAGWRHPRVFVSPQERRMRWEKAIADDCIWSVQEDRSSHGWMGGGNDDSADFLDLGISFPLSKVRYEGILPFGS